MHKRERELTLTAAQREHGATSSCTRWSGVTMHRDLDHFARIRCYQEIQRHYPRPHRGPCRCCRSRRAAPAPAKRCGTRSSAATTGAPTSSWSAITRAPRARRRPTDSDALLPESAPPRSSPRRARARTRNRHRSPPAASATSPAAGRYVPCRRRQACHAGPGTMDARRRRPRAPGSPREEEVPGLVHLSRGDLDALRTVYPPPREQGITLFFTGLSGSGKSTLAKIMYGKFIEEGRRAVTLLDGDVVRHHLSSELGFSKHAPRPQRAPHRLRRERDHQERRGRHLRADRTLRGAPAATCATWSRPTAR